MVMVCEKPRAKVQLLTLRGGAVTHTDQFLLDHEAFAHTLHHVGDERAVETVLGAVRLGITGARQGDLGAFLFQGDIRDPRLLQGALRTFHGHQVLVADR
jgi:hypothetical protein